MPTITIDSESRDVPEGARLADIAPDGALVAEVNGELVDLFREATEGDVIEFPGPDDPRTLHVMRHSAAHVMAQAVLQMFPDAKYAIGPATDDGFFYDFELPRTLTEDDLPAIEGRMRQIVKADQPFAREDIKRTEALEMFEAQTYKREILESTDELGDAKVGEVVSIYRNADAYTDLCLGPHVPSTGKIGHVKLMAVSGAHWRGHEDRAMLQRVKGTTWPTAEALDAYLKRLEEAERRDHRRLGRDLDLFSSPPELGAGLFVWHPKGGLVRKIIEDFSRDFHMERGYDIVASPHIGRSVLWETSGHLEKFAEGMFPAISSEEADYYLKPMNCPFHILIFKSRTRSYRELPLRFSELGTVYRHERSGVMHGLSRLRGFTQDDAHIFCRRDQLVEEVNATIALVVELYNTFGFHEIDVKLATKPGLAIGTPEMWDEAIRVLAEALDASPFEYEYAEGEGAFYGPKIEFHIKDAIGRTWQLATVQVDFALPERFGIEYIGADNQPHRPVMIHRALYGAVERFFAQVLEHYAGALPPWLSPVQARVVPLNDDILPEARAVVARLTDAGMRADVDDATESMQYKIRRGTLEKIPWLLVVGKRELEAGTVSVRLRNGDQKRNIAIGDFIADATSQIASKATTAT